MTPGGASVVQVLLFDRQLHLCKHPLLRIYSYISKRNILRDHQLTVEMTAHIVEEIGDPLGLLGLIRAVSTLLSGERTGNGFLGNMRRSMAVSCVQGLSCILCVFEGRLIERPHHLQTCI